MIFCGFYLGLSPCFERNIIMFKFAPSKITINLYYYSNCIYDAKYYETNLLYALV
jgi:hypothetical protein